MNADTRLIDITASELQYLLNQMEERIVKRVKAEIGCEDEKYVYGLEGIMKIYNCSKATAARIKKSGVIDDAICQFGRKITINVERALKLKPINN